MVYVTIKKGEKFFNYFKQKNVDILCLQETHSVSSDERFWSSEWGGRIIFAHGTNNSRGVAMLIAKHVEYDMVEVIKDIHGRYMLAQIKIAGRDIVISCIYGPNNDDPQFYTQVFSLLEQCDHPEWIVMGDFNLVLDNVLDVKKPNIFHSNRKAAELIKQLRQDHDLVDVWRYLNPQKQRYTFRRGLKIASRIDFVLISKSLLNGVKLVDILPSVLSDHSAIFLNLEINK